MPLGCPMRRPIRVICPIQNQADSQGQRGTPLYQKKGYVLESAERSGLVDASGHATIQAHGETLVQRNGHKPSANGHFTAEPGSICGKYAAENLIKLFEQAVIQGDFGKPGAALAQVGGELVAKSEELAEVATGDGALIYTC